MNTALLSDGKFTNMQTNKIMTGSLSGWIEWVLLEKENNSFVFCFLSPSMSLLSANTALFSSCCPLGSYSLILGLLVFFPLYWFYYNFFVPPATCYLSPGYLATWPPVNWPPGHLAICHLAIWTAQIIGKWGIHEKSFQNVAQLRWHYLRRTLQSKIMIRDNFWDNERDNEYINTYIMIIIITIYTSNIH